MRYGCHTNFRKYFIEKFYKYSGEKFYKISLNRRVYKAYMRVYLMSYKQLCNECGAIVKGTSEKHLKANMKLHKRGKNHKEIMEIKNREKKKE